MYIRPTKKQVCTAYTGSKLFLRPDKMLCSVSNANNLDYVTTTVCFLNHLFMRVQ